MTTITTPADRMTRSAYSGLMQDFAGADIADRYFHRAVEAMSRPELERLQELRLLDLLPRVYEHSPLVREVWQRAGIRPKDIRSLADFRALAPFTSKDAVREFRDRTGDPSGGLGLDDGVVGYATTSGTTGDPTLIPFVGRDRVLPPGKLQAAARVGHQRGFWEIGVRPGDYFTVALFTFRGPVWTNCQAIGAVPVLFEHSPAELERFCRMSIELRPTGMWMISRGLMMGLEQIAASGRYDLSDVFASYHGVCFAGEPLSARARASVREWGVELFEAGSLGDAECTIECREHDGLHFAEDEVLVEYLDPVDGTAVPPGTPGELVVTALDPTWPLVRYKSDDLVRWTTDRCGCGRTQGRLWTMGRKSDETVVGGVSIMVTDVWRAVEAIPECSAGLFQIVRASRMTDRLRLRVGFREEAARPAAQIIDDIIHELTGTLGIAPDVELVENEVLLRLGPPHKIPRITKE